MLHETLLLYALGFFLVLSSCFVGVCSHTLRALRHIDESTLPPEELLRVRFYLLASVCGLARGSILLPLSVITVVVLVHIGLFDTTHNHLHSLFLVGFLWFGGLLVNSLLKDIYLKAIKGLKPK